MASAVARFIIGIDLGTTNSAVAWTDAPDTPTMAGEYQRNIRLFEIPQVTAETEISRLTVLPSFLFLAGPYDPWCFRMTLPWERSDEAPTRPPVGAFARDYGADRPDRLVVSAKSWLCHGGVDRRAPILPWGAAEEVPRISPVQAAAAYLRHIRDAWNAQWPDDEAGFMEHQLVVLTVPASFDEVARDLTLEAASLAGLPEVVLLEEPLAAFYSWLMQHETDWRRHITPGERVLVCDVGGGTTDLTLISLREAEGSPRFERLAVGDHLILGGDNMDLALARRVAPDLRPSGRSLTPQLWKTLCHQCRQAKERLLAGRQDTCPITLMGRGRRLIADTLRAELTAADVEKLILDGFFPVDPPAPQATAPRKGISELGLPYEPQPAITAHITRFLQRHASPSGAGSDPDTDPNSVPDFVSNAPDLILFNGGALKPQSIQARIRQALQRQCGRDDPNFPRVLANPQPEVAVALGAAYYGLVKSGAGVRVGSGSPRAWYLGVASLKKTDSKDPKIGAPAERSEEEGVRGNEQNNANGLLTPHSSLLTPKGGSREALCLVERGLDEGTSISLPQQRFEVRANQLVSFELYSSSFRSGDRCGDRILIDDTLTPLPPIETVIQYGRKSAATRLPVAIEALYTEIGTLALWCRSLISDHRWRLQFSLREQVQTDGVTESVIFEKDRVDRACLHVREVLETGTRTPRLIRMTRDLAEILETPKAAWPLGLLRSLADTLIELAPRRRVTPEHESRWLNLTGFCLRPGFGDGFDGQRMQALWKIYLQGAVFARHAQVSIEWWILWRRVAGGLNTGQQRQFFQSASVTLGLGKSRKSAPMQREQMETWMALGAMERLPVKDKITLGRHLLANMPVAKTSPQQWWVLGRLGARDLLYGPLDRVLPPAEISQWFRTIIKMNVTDIELVAAALTRLGRRTGDQARDLPPQEMVQILNWIDAHPDLQHYRNYLTSVIPMARQEADQVFGEQLPAGLVWVEGVRSKE